MSVRLRGAGRCGRALTRIYSFLALALAGFVLTVMAVRGEATAAPYVPLIVLGGVGALVFGVRSWWVGVWVDATDLRVVTWTRTVRIALGDIVQVGMRGYSGLLSGGTDVMLSGVLTIRRRSETRATAYQSTFSSEWSTEAQEEQLVALIHDRVPESKDYLQTRSTDAGGGAGGARDR